MQVKDLKALPPTRRIILPIDTPDLAAGLELAGRLMDWIWGVKIGHIPLAVRGAPAVRMFVDRGIRVMADPKLDDIPFVVRGAAQVYRDHGAELCTMHASMDVAGMRAVAEACGNSMFSLAVTVLTSISEKGCRKIFRALPSIAVSDLAKLALLEGNAHGIVCSPADLNVLAERVPGFRDHLIVTPGVRPAGEDTHDQARVGTPGQAIRNGAKLLVIGRAITGAKDPVAAARAIVDEIDEALG